LPLAIRDQEEPEVIRRLIRDYRAQPPREPVKHWYWPVSIETLGRFEVLLEGKPLQSSAKPPRRTLALLKAIVAFGGDQVPESKLLEALWSDLEGDAAHRALEAGVHRLRVLLRAPEVIRQKGGMLILDTSRCWIDAQAFDFWTAKSADDEDAADHALGLYGGAFLAEESEEWAFPERERLRSRFIRLVSHAARSRETAGRLDDAVALYLRGLDADPLVESFYQGLMRCYGRQQRATEAAAVYRRMRQTLSVVLGISPSAASDRLFRETVYPSDHA
jgi:LuxR family transcriptional regulator, maltose regulon positive regulatory protein